MTFSEFNAAVQRLAAQYPVKASVSVDVQSWTYFDDEETPGRTRLCYGASWQAAGYECLVSGGDTPEDALNSLAGQLAVTMPLVAPSGELDAVNVDDIPQVRGPS